MVGARGELRRFAELLGLTGFAFAQPVLDAFGRAPEHFAFRGADTRSIVWFGIAVAFGPALAVGALAAATAVFGRGARRAVQIVLVGALGGTVALQVVRHATSLEGPVLVAFAAAAAVGTAAAYVHLPALATWLRYTAVGPMLFLVLFLFFAPVSGLVTGDDVAAASSRGGSGTSVVYLQLDELPTSTLLRADGTIDDELFPNFARLADRSVWFRNFVSVSNQTVYAIPALLTGRLPETGTRPIAADHSENLFTLLGGTYDVRADEAATRLCPRSVCEATRATDTRALLRDALGVVRMRLTPRATPRPIAEGLVETTARQTADDARGDQRDDDAFLFDDTQNRPERFDDFLAALAPSRRPRLDYLHLLLPHQPWRHYASGALYDRPEVDPGRAGTLLATWTDEPWPPTVARARHVVQTQYTDRLVGRLLDHLDATGMTGDVVLIVAADHGVTFEPGADIRLDLDATPTAAAVSDLAFTPLFVAAPGLEPRIDDLPVESVDLVPTIAGILGIRLPWAVDGESAVSPERDSSRARFCRAYVVPFRSTDSEPCREIDVERAVRLVRSRAAGHEMRDGAPAEWRPYTLGEPPGSDLVGTRLLAATPADTRPPPVATVADVQAFAEVDLERALPGVVRGRVEGIEPGTADVVVAVNGTVVGVSPVYRDDGGAVRFLALAPDWVFRTGANEITLHARTGDGRLQPVVVR